MPQYEHRRPCSGRQCCRSVATRSPQAVLCSDGHGSESHLSSVGQQGGSGRRRLHIKGQRLVLGGCHIGAVDADEVHCTLDVPAPCQALHAQQDDDGAGTRLGLARKGLPRMPRLEINSGPAPASWSCWGLGFSTVEV